LLSKEKIGRINLLAKKSKGEGLTEEEKKEQKLLRKEYIENAKKSLRNQLDNIEIVD
jgi:uncharacterized protein YnzC (UPF0291/DUF896 family)